MICDNHRGGTIQWDSCLCFVDNSSLPLNSHSVPDSLLDAMCIPRLSHQLDSPAVGSEEMDSHPPNDDALLGSRANRVRDFWRRLAKAITSHTRGKRRRFYRFRKRRSANKAIQFWFTCQSTCLVSTCLVFSSDSQQQVTEGEVWRFFVHSVSRSASIC